MKFPWVSRASRDEARLHAEKWREEALESRRKLCRIAEIGKGVELMLGFVSEKKYNELLDDFAKQSEDRAELVARLAKIASMETPNCANIGKRMAAVARGEM